LTRAYPNGTLNQEALVGKEHELMEPITFTAIVASLGMGVATGAGQAIGENVIKAYRNLVSSLKDKFGDNSEVVRSIENLKTKPDSAGRKQTLQEELEASGADQDPQVRQAAQELLDQLKTQPGGEQHIQNAMGSYIAQADRGSIAEVRVNQPEE
jgi:Arc/MetJ-type ribon-helix-helix transcriptional regulator